MQLVWLMIKILLALIITLRFNFVVEVGAARTLNDCVMDIVKNPYTGTVSVTNHGFTCQAWAAQYPRAHVFTDEAFFPADDGVVGASNYCRKFGSFGRPWCYTTHPHIFFENCELRICNGNSNGTVIIPSYTTPVLIRWT